MSSLAAAKADNFYYPPDFDPKKHQTLNKYNGQHPLRERAAKLDQGILVIRFEIPFNIWCDKCGEHIAKGERFNAEKKAIGQYYSTKILQFTMTHHCGCKITIQTDPKRAEYLVVEGARKKLPFTLLILLFLPLLLLLQLLLPLVLVEKEESYSAADAEVIELPDEGERERRERDPLYRLEYQQGAKVKALTGAERLAAIHDVVDARTADPYSLNRTLRAALRGEKRAAAALDTRRAELGLPDSVPLLAPSDGDTLAAQVAFLTSSARAVASAEARRKRILEQDIFTSSSSFRAAAPGAAGSAVVVDAASEKRHPAPAHPPPSKRPALSTAPAPAAPKVRVAVTQLAAASGDRQATRAELGAEVPATRYQQDREAAAQEGQPEPLEEDQVAAQKTRGALTGSSCMARAVDGAAPPGCRDEEQQRRDSNRADVAAGLPKRSLKDRAAELQKRRQCLGGVGLTLNRQEL
ncbi:hypothetical protein VOLCADRAFT_106033 [Volvox carteri f. nagariensis]|uniref:Coiled-coil domain-containing protein 130 n=1 Tax=Volvox carteri f. nagariensis TaxID=3068 RepID=D8U4N1_VOLCA|nr:uncharacterized protein VOLCADRAFT_106033 [Volvox carteri f. nagariensis]EFJ45218.1 hypothetical protein VOLCADRAFT_106033 [Volvox carteri f. nagariensis]|eukprot:XP_002953594.1 hypothetical protein VOLCADRAFT_106033 [Volvox carteri f. nagariensis]